MHRPAQPTGAGPISQPNNSSQLGVVDLFAGVRGDVKHDLAVGVLTKLVGEDREVVEQAVPARVHDRQVGRIVLDGPNPRPATGSDQ